jgi:DMSO/TMAO reductase YedYZ molybdopterin-dependent catalytic subunit
MSNRKALSTMQGVIILVVIIAAIAGAVYYMSLPSTPPIATIVGTVTDADTSTPLTGATVASDGQTTTSAADGTYSLEVTPGHSYTVTVTKTGYDPGTSTVNANDAGTFTVNVSLSRILQFTITLVALNGSEYVVNENTFEALQHVEYEGGLITSAGSIRDVSNYTGVLATVLCESIGGLSNETSLRVTASDDYSMVFTYDQITGDFVTFDPVTGDEVNHTQPLHMFFAYLKNGAYLPESDGPIRLVVLGPEGLITEGHNWVKRVVKIEVRQAVTDWTVTLDGYLTEEMDRATFESGVNCHPANWTDGDGQFWEGIPLWLLVGRVDDVNVHETNDTYKAFNRTLASDGYRIQVIAVDDYTMEFNSTFVALNDDIIVANTMDGKPLLDRHWPLKLVGPALSNKQMVASIATIKLVFGDDWNVSLSGALSETMTREVFEAGADCHPATWTDDEGQVWSGIPLWLLVGRVDDALQHGPDAFNRTLADQGYTVRLIAADDYTVTLNSSFIALNNDLILCNEVDNMPLQEDNWPLKLVCSALPKSKRISMVTEIQIVYEG